MSSGEYDTSLNLARDAVRKILHSASLAGANYGQTWWRARVPGSQPWDAVARREPQLEASVPNPTAPWEEWGVPSAHEVRRHRLVSHVIPRSAWKQAAQARDAHLWPDRRSRHHLDEREDRRLHIRCRHGSQRTRSTLDVLRAGENTIAVAALDTYATGGMLGTLAQHASHARRWNGDPAQRRVEVRDRAFRELGPPPRAPWESTGGHDDDLQRDDRPARAVHGSRRASGIRASRTPKTRATTAKLMTAWMTDWRKRFEAPELPFLVVQLANYGAVDTTPTESGYAELREAQRAVVAKDAHAGLAVAIDIGERYDIHPANKQEVGRRLARAARHVVYGEALAPSGPVASRATRSGKDILVEFKDVQGRLTAIGALTSQASKFADPLPARASSPAQPPTAIGCASLATDGTRVRYCWADSPICTLYDGSGLPAGPFELPIQ